MPDVYDQLFEEEERRLRDDARPPGAPGGPDVYDSIFDAEAAQRDVRLNVVLRHSVQSDPDKAAAQKALASKTGLPRPLVERNEARVAELQRVRELNELARFSPILARQLADPEFAKLAHDDAENLSEFEKAVGVLRPTRGPRPSFTSVVSGTASALPQSLEAMREGIRLQFADVFGLDSMRVDALRKAGRLQHRELLTTPDFKSATAEGFYGGATSLIRQAPGIAASILTGTPLPALASIGAMTEAEAYSKYRLRGATPGQAGVGAIGEGVVEVATELLPMKFLVDSFGKVGAGRFLTGLLGRELPTEQVATLVQDAIDTAIANPEKTWQQYIAERPEAAYKTALATIVQTGTLSAIHAVAGRVANANQQHAEAQHDTQALQRVNDIAKASKLRARDPESFREFVEQAAEGSATHVYVDAATFAQTLEQSGVALADVAAQVPSIGEQIEEALDNEGTLQIPIGEYVAHLAAEPYAQALLPHLKLDPEAPSLTEAQTLAQEEANALEAEVGRVAAEQQAAAAIEEGAQLVESWMIGQLRQANRFTDDVNAAYAALARDFYTTMAQRVGISAQEFLQRYPLQIRAESVPGAQAFDQGGKFTPEFQKWFEGSKIVDSRGKPLVVYHSTTAVFDKFRRSRSDIGFHFGTAGQAEDLFAVKSRRGGAKAGSSPLTLPVYLAIKNPVRLEDPGSWTPRFGLLTDQLLELFPDSKKAIQGLTTPRDVREFLEARGHDGVVYRNTGEISGAEAFRKARNDAWERLNQGTRTAEEQVGYQEAQAALEDYLDSHQEDSYIAFRPEQIKSIFNERPTASPNILEQSAFHGSPHVFDRFSLHAIGTGEGAQAYGWGLYFSSKKEIAKYYRDTLAENIPIVNFRLAGRDVIRNEEYQDYSPRDNSNFENVWATLTENLLIDEAGLRTAFADGKLREHVLAEADSLIERYQTDWPEGVAAARDLRRMLERKSAIQFKIGEKTGRIYQVEIPDDDTMLDWDKPLSEQSEKVKDAIRLMLKQEGYLRPDDNGPRQLTKAWKAFVNERGGFSDGDTGGVIYDALSKKFGGQVPGMPSGVIAPSAEGASRYLASLGVTGIKYSGGTSGSTNYVIFDDKLVRITGYEQPNRGEIRVASDITKSPSTISLLKNADLSTFIHESGHFFLEVLTDLAARPNAPQQITADMGAVLKWFGVESLDAWRAMSLEQKRQYHEKFARGFEAYVFEGRAPSLQMQSIFARFRAWLLNVYKSLKALNVELTDEVRAVFDRMLASDEQIKLAETARAYEPLFENAERAGMTPEAFAEYQALGAVATADAVSSLERRSLRDMQWLSNAKGRKLREMQRRADAKRAEVRAEVEAEVMSDPVYRVRELIAHGTLRETGDEELNSRQSRLLTELGLTGTKLSLPALKEMYGDSPAAPWRYLSTGEHGLAATEGVHPDIYAELFGFSSGDEVVRKLLEAPAPGGLIDAMTDQRMLERHGDLIDAQSIERAAEAAIHNDARAKFLEREVNTLAGATGPRRPLLAAAKQYAEAAIARAKVRDLRPSQYSVAEAKASRAATAAWKAGDTAKAAQHKRAQLLSNQLFRAADRAVDEVDKGVEYLKKFGREGTRKNLRGEFLDQLDALLERFDLRTSLTRRQIDEQRQPLAEWVRAESERLAAVVPDLPSEILNENYRKHFRNLTVEEFRGLVDAVKQLERLARREQQAYIAIRDMTFAEEEARILEELRRHNPDAFDADDEPKGVQPDYVPSIKRGLTRAGDKLQAEFLNVETLLNLMSGGQMGQAHESLFGRLTTRADWKASKLQELYAYFKPLFGQYSVRERLEFSQRGHYIPAIGTSLTRENMVIVALHYGNAEGRLRLLQGHGWGDAHVQAIVAQLDAKDWRLVDGIWRMFDENLWPELKALNERTRGKAPPKVEALPYATPHGTARGGYFRIKYDTDLSERAHHLDEASAVQDMLGGSMGMPRTNQGTSAQRLQEVKRPLRLDLGVMSETINETVHDLAFREAVADTWRLLSSKRIQNAIKSASGTEVYRAIVQRLRETAAPPRNPTGFIERTLATARKNTLVVAMGLSVKTAIVNMTGIFPAFSRVNAGALLRNIAKFYSPKMSEYYRFILDRSEYMRNRHDSYERDLQDAVKRFSATGSLLPEYAGWFALITYVDKGTSAPTWLAAYEEAMKRHGNDEARAIQYADHIVRQTHGSGRIVDLANVQSGHGGWGQLKRAFTMFYGYFGAQLGLLVRSGKLNAQALKAGDPFAVARLAADFTLIVILPAVLAEIASGRCDKASDAADWGKCIARATTMYMSGFVPIWRDFASFTWSLFDQDVHNFGFKITPLESFFEGIGKGIKSTADVASGEGDETDAKNIILGVSYLLGLPGYQIWRTIAGIEAAAEGNAGPQAVLLGPAPRR